MRGRRGVLLLVVLALVGAPCGGGGGEAPSSAPVSSGVAVRLALQDATGNKARSFSAGDPIHLRIEVENESATVASLRFSSGRTYDAVIYGEGGSPVWRWSEGRFFTQALTHLELAPGETVGFGVLCESEPDGQPLLAPGLYRVIAVIPGVGDELRSEPAPLQVR